MTLTAEQDVGRKPLCETANKRDGSRFIIRLALRVLAAALVLSGLCLWVLPGSNRESEVLLFKLVLSMTAFFGGVGLWQTGMAPAPPVVELDIKGGELRLVRECGPVRRRLIEQCRFDDLGGAEQNGRQITLWAKDARMLAEITLGNAAAHAILIRALRRAGKLA